jgi:hypothetical protein
MATETRPQVDAAEVYSRLGRIEGEQAQMNLRFDDMNTRLDRLEAAQTRLLYWVLGIGAAILASVWVRNLTG